MKYFLLEQNVFIEHTDLIYQNEQCFLAISLSGSDSQLSLLPTSWQNYYLFVFERALEN